MGGGARLLNDGRRGVRGCRDIGHIHVLFAFGVLVLVDVGGYTHVRILVLAIGVLVLLILVVIVVFVVIVVVAVWRFVLLILVLVALTLHDHGSLSAARTGAETTRSLCSGPGSALRPTRRRSGCSAVVGRGSIAQLRRRHLHGEFDRRTRSLVILGIRIVLAVGVLVILAFCVLVFIFLLFFLLLLLFQVIVFVLVVRVLRHLLRGHRGRSPARAARHAGP